MNTLPRLLAACLFATMAWPAAQAAPGDVVVPAHRTRDGHYVPPNVPPLSGGTQLARRPARSAAMRKPAPPRLAPPILVEAQAVRR
jgi:hypothetical protein